MIISRKKKFVRQCLRKAGKKKEVESFYKIILKVSPI